MSATEYPRRLELLLYQELIQNEKLEHQLLYKNHVLSNKK